MATKKELEKRIAALEDQIKALSPKPPLAVGTLVTLQGRVLQHDPDGLNCEYEVDIAGVESWFPRSVLTVVT